VPATPNPSAARPTVVVVVGASSWVWGWNTVVAFGTLALAAATAVLAGFTLGAVRQSRDVIKLQTRELEAVEKQTGVLTEQTAAVKAQAEATKRQVDISMASLEATSRPVLVGLVADLGWHPTRERDALREKITIKFVDDHEASLLPDAVHYEITNDKIYFSVPLRNVGAGVAFIQRVELVTSRGDFPLPGRVTEPVVPRDETTRVLFSAVRKQSDGSTSEWEEITGIGGRGFAQFTIRAVYTGASHELVTVTELTTSQITGGGFIYTAQQVWNGEGDDRELLVSTDNIAA